MSYFVGSGFVQISEFSLSLCSLTMGCRTILNGVNLLVLCCRFFLVLVVEVARSICSQTRESLRSINSGSVNLRILHKHSCFMRLHILGKIQSRCVQCVTIFITGVSVCQKNIVAEWPLMIPACAV